jgi:hypothetical protein
MGMLLVMCPNTGQPISTGIETDEYSLRQIAGAAYWDTSRGEIIARGLAATQAVARAEALRAARSHVDPTAGKPAFLSRRGIATLAPLRGSLGAQRSKATGTTDRLLAAMPPIHSRFSNQT